MQIKFDSLKKGLVHWAVPFFIFILCQSFAITAHSKSRWALGVGAGWLHDYPGAGQGRIRFLPFPVYRGSVFRVDRISGVSGEVYNDSRIDFSWNFIFQFPTASKDIPARIGMPDLDWVFSLGPQLKYYIYRHKNHKTFFRFPIRFNTCTNFGSRTHFCGTSFNPGFRHSMWYKGYGEFTFRFEAFSHTSEYQKYFYEVPPEYATATRSAYHARAGYLGLVYGVSHSIPFDGWDFSSSANVYDYNNAVNLQSPLLIQKTNFAVFFAVTIDL